MRLTADLVEKSAAFTNALGLRELDLRSNKIPAIENLAVTKLDNFPTLKRLRALLCSNNQISRIDDDFGSKLPSLEMLVLSGNKFANIDSLSCLASSKSLLHLSLLDNPISQVPDYRLKLIALLPFLRSLDFQQVTASERSLSKNMPEDGTVTRVAEKSSSKSAPNRPPVLSHMHAAIEQASTLEEVENLRRTLQSQRRGAH